VAKKAVLAGCGGISRAWLKAVSQFDDVDIVGMVDLVAEAIDTRREEFDLHPKATGDDLAMVIRESGADTVFDCTVPPAHRSVVTTALAAGCDVLGEKPMAESMDDARAMVDAAEKAGKTYAVIQNRRYNPNIIRYRDALRSGGIGEITTLNADFYIGAHFGGFREKMNHVLLVDMAIHSFDEVRFISEQDPVSVYCHEWNPKGSWYRHGASAMAIFEMTGGLIVSYRGSWCAEGLNTSWECSWRAIGERGSVLWDGFDAVKGERVAKDEGFRRPMMEAAIAAAPEVEYRGHAGVIREFLDSLEAGTKPQTICTDNIKSVAMVHAAVESAEKGARVAVRW
jgi:predicted dehydrogenase